MTGVEKLAVVVLLAFNIILIVSKQGTHDILDYGVYQCYLRSVANCFTEFRNFSEALEYCQKFTKINLANRAADVFPNCEVENETCWRTCGELLPGSSGNMTLKAPVNVTVRFAGGSASNANALFVEWDPVPGAVLYFGQILDSFHAQYDWTKEHGRMNLTTQNSATLFFDKMCVDYSFRIAAASAEQVGPFSEIYSSPTSFPSSLVVRANVSTKYTAIPKYRDTYFDTDSQVLFGIKVIFPDDAHRKRMKIYKLHAVVFVQYDEQSDYYLAIKEYELMLYHDVGLIRFPEQIAKSTCDIILLVDGFRHETCPPFNVSQAFRLNFYYGGMKHLCTSNDTRSLVRDQNQLRSMKFLNSSDYISMTIFQFSNDTENKEENSSIAVATYSVDQIQVVDLNVSEFSDDWMPFSTAIEMSNRLESVTLSESEPKSANRRIVIVGMVLVSVLFALTIAAVKVISARRKSTLNKTGQEASKKRVKNRHYFEYPLRMNRGQWEVHRDDVRILHDCKLGAGAFGNVHKGFLYYRTPILQKMNTREKEASDGSLIVAVKSYPSYASPLSISNFREEIELMKTIGYNERLVNMIACVTTEPLLLIIEYCSGGALLEYLRDRRAYMIKIEKMYQSLQNAMNECKDIDMNLILSMEDLLCFAWQVSCGMQYLSDKGFIHRDLAARNILVDDGKRAKIGDFGLCRYSQSEAIYSSRGGRLPVKWMALESLKDAEFTSASDVWSFGVLLFELITLGGSPYPNIDPIDIQPHLEAGRRMDKPDNCSEELFALMLNTWEADRTARPKFAAIQSILRNMIEELSSNDYYMALNESKDYYNVIYKDSEIPVTAKNS